MLRYLIAFSLFATAVSADVPQVTHTEISITGDIYNFTVTVQHNDEDWDHYVEHWVVRAPGGKILGKRDMNMPHSGSYGRTTRTLSGVRIPGDLRQVSIQAHDIRHGWGPPTTVSLHRIKHGSGP